MLRRLAIGHPAIIRFCSLQRLLSAIALILFASQNHAQVIFNEPFDEPNTSTTGVDNVGGVVWTSSCPTCLVGDYWHVNNGVFEGNDTNGDAIWETGLIDISSLCNDQVEISLTISEVGDLEACGTGCNSVDWIRLQYNINGTGWQNPVNSFLCAGACAGINVIQADDILPSGSMSYTTGCIGPGSTLQVRIGVQCWAQNEFWRIDNVNVSFCPIVSTLTITDPAPVCAPATVNLTAAAVTAGSSAGALTYWTNATATNPLASSNAVAVSGTYYIQLDNGGCPVIMPVIVVVNPLITPTFSAIPNVCQGSTAPVLPTTSTNAITGSWSPAVSTASAGTTSYTFTPSAGQCASTTTLSITVNPLLAPTFTTVGTICQGGTAPVLPTTSTNGINGSWSPAVSTASAGTTSHTFTPTSGQCASTATMTITVSSLITPTFAPIGTLCQGSTAPVLPTTSTNAISGIWAPAVSTANTGTTTYTFTPNAGQCASSTTLDITVDVSIIPTFVAVSPICQGDAAPVLPTTSTNAINGTWSPAVSTNTAGTTTYTFTPNAGQCASITTLDMIIDPLPMIDAGLDQTICEGTAITLNVTTSVPYVWDNGVTDGVPFTPAAGTITYTVTGTGASGCVNSDQVDVAVIPLPLVNAGADQTMCDGTPLSLNGGGAVTYVWDNGVTNGVPFSPAIGTITYTVIGSDAFGCMNTDEVNVTVEPSPVVSFTADVTGGCAPLEVTFTNTTPGILSNCEWLFGNGLSANGCGSVTANYSSSGMFDVTLTTTSVNGCSNSDTYVDYISVEAAPVASFNQSSNSITTLNSNILFFNTSTGATNYLWNFEDGQSTATTANASHTFPNQSQGVYNVELIAYSAFGCTDTASATISVLDEVLFYVPNSFTPDGDAFNQTFQPVFTSGFDAYDFDMYIFNRYGEIIFESHDATIGWDGTYGVGNKSRSVQDATYVWKIAFKTTLSDERIEVMGHVNLIR